MLKNIYTVLKYTDNYIISLLKFKYNYIDINNYKQWNFINNFNQDKIVITDTNLFNEKVYNKEEFNDFNSHKPYVPPINVNRCPALEQQTIQVENGKFYPCTRFQYEHKAIENNAEDIQKVYNNILQNKYKFLSSLYFVFKLVILSSAIISVFHILFSLKLKCFPFAFL